MNDRRTNAAPIAIAVLLAVPLLYVGSYFALVEVSDGAILNTDNEWAWVEKYRVGTIAARVIYKPLNWVDRQLRPSYWQTDVFVVDGGPVEAVHTHE
jgi:hypothetical protein